jgi:hypothetical protein
MQCYLIFDCGSSCTSRSYCQVLEVDEACVKFQKWEWVWFSVFSNGRTDRCWWQAVTMTCMRVHCGCVDDSACCADAFNKENSCIVVTGIIWKPNISLASMNSLVHTQMYDTSVFMLDAKEWSHSLSYGIFLCFWNITVIKESIFCSALLLRDDVG